MLTHASVAFDGIIRRIMPHNEIFPLTHFSIARSLIHAGASPYVKILAASEQPAVYVDDDGILIISPESCDVNDVSTPAPERGPSGTMTNAPTTMAPSGGDTTSSSVRTLSHTPLGALLSFALGSILVWPASSSSSTATTTSTKKLFFSTHVTTLTMLLLTMACTTWVVQGDGHDMTCKPTLSIEVGVPAMAPVTETFGETDHYLAANVDTVVWGYYGTFLHQC